MMMRFAAQVVQYQAKMLTPLAMASFAKDIIKEKGRGDEEVYFSREESIDHSFIHKCEKSALWRSC
jgi:hypothetical protein